MKRLSILIILALLVQVFFPQSAAACNPEIAVTPHSINFGSVLVDTTSPPQTVKVCNQGSADLVISSIIIVGDYPDQFDITSDTSVTRVIHAGCSLYYSLTFGPDSAGNKSAILRIRSNDGDERTVNVALCGTGKGVPNISVDPTSVPFGDVFINEESGPQTVIVTNQGTAALTIGTISISGDGQFKFATPGDDISGQTLAPTASATIALVFKPTSEGAKSATLNIPSNDLAHNPVVVTLTGKGIAPGIAVDRILIDFGEVLINNTSGPQTVIVTNQGTAALTIGTISISGDGQFKFATPGDDISGQTLASDASANITLVFKPTSEGAKSATLTIPSNDLAHNPVVVELKGNGKTIPDIAVDQTVIDFGLIQVGTSATRTVTVSNNGTANLTINTIEISDNINFNISGIEGGDSFASGQSTIVTIVFTPNAAETYEASFTITSNDPDAYENPLVITLRGAGTTGPVAPEITVSPNPVDFGDVLVGTPSATRQVTISNNGTADLVIYTRNTSGDLFQITGGIAPGDTLAPGTSATISLVFTPSATGLQTGTLTITSSDADEGTTVIDLHGTGIPVIADLDISIADSPDPAKYAEDITYTITVTNQSPQNATGVQVNTALSPYVKYISVSDPGNASRSGDNVNWTIGNLASGASATLNITVQLKTQALFYGSVTTTASVTGNQTDPNLADNTDSESTAVLSTDLKITKTADPDTIGLTGNISWTVTVENLGPNTANDVMVIDAYVTPYTTINTITPSVGSIIPTLPAWLTDFAAETGLPIAPPPTDYSLLLWSIGDLASGATATMTITGAANFSLPPSFPLPLLAIWGPAALPNFLLPNSALVLSTLGDPDYSNNSALVTTAADAGFPEADLAITKTDSPDPVLPGDNITYTVTVRNNGTDNATGVFVLDVFYTPQLTYQSATPSQGTASTTLLAWLIPYAGSDPSLGYVYWDVGNLASGGTATLTLVATVNAAIPLTTTIGNGAVVSGPVIDANISNNFAFATTSVASGELSIVKGDSPDPVGVGGNLTYDLIVVNNGPFDAPSVVVTDNLPAGVTWVSNTSSLGTASFAGGSVTWTIDNLAKDTWEWLHIEVTAPLATGTITNNASVTSAYPDPDASNNSASQDTLVVPSIDADLSIVKLDSADPVATNGDLTYTLTVTNNGPADATGVKVIDALPTTVTYVSNSGTATYASGNVTWDIGNLASGASVTLNILVTAPSTTGTITNTATVTSGTTDPVPGNNSASESTLVAAPTDTDLAITKIDSPDPVVAGGNLNYTLTVTNNGPGNATAITVTDVLPPTATYVSDSEDTATYASGNVAWNIASLDKGASATLEIIVTAPATAGNITNTASVTSATNDPNLSNNSATQTTEVITVPVYTDLRITKIDSPDPAITGGNLTYTITVTNSGPGNATGVSVTDTLPPEVTYVSHTASTGIVTIGGTINWTIGDLASGASATLTIVTNVTATSGTITNTATVSGNEIDLLPLNNTISVLTLVLPSGFWPDIDVTPTSIDFGTVAVSTTSAIHSVTVSNNGTISLTIYSAATDDGQFVILSGITPGDAITPGGSRTITLSFTPGSTGAKTANLTITSNDPDENPVTVTLSGTGNTPTPPPPPPPPPPSPEPTPTPTPPPAEMNFFTVDFLGRITKVEATDDGRPVIKIEAPSPDDKHLLEIEALTGATVIGETVTLIEIREAEAPGLPENTQLVGKAYEFRPNGTVFDQPVKLTLGYNVNDLPEGVKSVGLAFYTTTEGWVYLEAESSNVAELGKLTAPVDHFTVFTVLAEVPAPTEPEPPPEPPEPPLPKPAEFNLNNLNITTSEYKVFESLSYIIRTGEDAVITVNVSNTGEQAGTYTVVLKLNGAERESKDITLQPGQSGTVAFDVKGNEPGIYDVVVGNLNGEFESKLWINWWLIAGSIAVVILIGWLVWYIIQRRKHKPTTA